jgi:type I restriction enzyme S subunit
LGGVIRDGQDLNYGNFCRVDLPLIPLEEQRAIAKYIARATIGLDKENVRLTHEIDLLREYRTRLVADVVTGKLDVRAAAAALPQDELPSTTEAGALNADDDLDTLDESEPNDEETAA